MGGQPCHLRQHLPLLSAARTSCPSSTGSPAPLSPSPPSSSQVGPPPRDQQPPRPFRTQPIRPIGVAGSVRASVENGLVTLEGEVESPLLAHLLSRLAQGVEGVVGVNSRLSSRRNDPDPHHLAHLLGTQAAHWSR